MIDRTTKFLLGAIALGLWAHLLSPFIAPPAVAQADYYLSEIDASLDAIESDIDDLEDGSCSNSQLC